MNNSAGSDYTISGSGSIGDSGFIGGTSLTKSGTGTLTLSTANAYAGPTNVQQGLLKVGVSGALPQATQLILGSGANSGAVDLNGFDTTVGGISSAGTATANVIGNSSSTPITLTVTNSSGVFNGAIRDGFNGAPAGGTIALTVQGGTLTLAGDNTYTGQTSVAQNATLQIGNGGAAGAIGNTFINVDGTLIFNSSGNINVANTVGGAGALQQIGTGTTTLAADSFYAGLTTISAGTLQVGNGAFAGSIGGGGPITDNALLAYNRSDDFTLANVISGTGAVEQRGTGTITMNTAQAYSGGTRVNAGTVRITAVNAGGTGTLTVNPGGTLVSGVAALTNPITLAGGTFGAINGLGSITNAALTAAPGTTSTVYLTDPQNLTLNSDLVFNGIGSIRVWCQ